MNRPLAKTPDLEPARLFDPSDIPPALRKMQDDLSSYTIKGEICIRWGWRQWRLMAPELAKHIQRHGRDGLSAAVKKAQRLLPKEHRRAPHAIASATGPNSKPDVLQIVAFLKARQDSRSTAARLALVTTQATHTVNDDQPNDDQGDNPFPSLQADARPMRGGHQGSAPGMVWGWRQWREVAPAVHAHLSTYGRAGLARAMADIQQTLEPEMHRTARCWSVRLAPSALAPDVVALVDHIMQSQGFPPLVLGTKAKPPTFTKPRPARVRVAKAQEAARTPAQAAIAAQVAPTHMPAGATAYAPAYDPAHDPALAGLMNTTLGALLPALKAFIVQIVREVQTPAPAAAAAPAPAATPEPAAAAPAPAPADPQPDDFAEGVAPPEPPAKAPAPVAAATIVQDPAASRALFDVALKLHKAPHDIESQLALAAKALGIAPAAAVRETVLCVGLHPVVEQEVSKFYGRHFRFVFKRPDAVRGPNDVPASTDIILLCRKGPTRELLALSRRDNLPLKNIQNNSGAVLGALREVFPESSDGLHIQ